MTPRSDGNTAAKRILELPVLLERLTPLRARGLKVVFTNGCFDLMHAGHAALLEAAAAGGDALVVGLNSDASVSRLKGAGRPLVPQHARALLVASLRAVDYVVIFGEDTPAQLIEQLLPDVLIKGEDYPLDQIVGREVVESHGGRVVRLPLLEGFSTSALIRRLRDDAL
ncbi:MAG: D-glycero-beta-D-manno-heptose 1-phosphate adenylyltransferase [Candidatus Eisenbacteria sp.]|nr:D-glycero-beta-D-manno-heptose 1-phosphate adenylyltransferase [Candidatus Eisenbacteria bacterium]